MTSKQSTDFMMSPQTSTPAAVPPVPGGAAAGVVPNIGQRLQSLRNDDTEAQITFLTQAIEELRHALESTRP